MIFKMKEKTYRVPQNVWFMIKLAWTSGEKKVLVLGLLSALLAVALNLARLYISPAVLAVLEKQASLTELLKTIGGFVLVWRLLVAAWYIPLTIYRLFLARNIYCIQE